MCKGKGCPLFFSFPDHRVFGSGTAVPQKLEKNNEASPEGDPCGTPLALTLLRKMDVGLIWKMKRTQRMIWDERLVRGCKWTGKAAADTGTATYFWLPKGRRKYRWQVLKLWEGGVTHNDDCRRRGNGGGTSQVPFQGWQEILLYSAFHGSVTGEKDGSHGAGRAESHHVKGEKKGLVINKVCNIIIVIVFILSYIPIYEYMAINRNKWSKIIWQWRRCHTASRELLPVGLSPWWKFPANKNGPRLTFVIWKMRFRVRGVGR